MTQQYFQVEVRAKQSAIEAVEFALSEAGADGTELDLLGKQKTAEIVSINGYFAAAPDEEAIKAWIASGLEVYEQPADAIELIEIRQVENLDWLSEWKKHWQPTETAKFIVAPTWSEFANVENKTVLRIEPGMAFGTGTHATTRLCLQAIEENYRGGSVFDVGTGTGVLAIGIAKLKIKNEELKISERILACDTDVDSVAIAKENAEVNHVADKIEFYVGSISAETPIFDFVIANLTADVIVPLLPLLIEKAGKILILSGILVEQQKWVAAELAKFQISNQKIEVQGEWISILAEK